MSPPSSQGRFSWVLLRKDIPIFHADEKRPEDLVMGSASKDCEDIKDGSLILEQLSLDAHLVEPPELSTLFFRAKLEALQRGIICLLDSVVDNFVYITLLFDNRVYGLVYDAAKNSLSLVPDPTAKDPSAVRHLARSDISVRFEFLRQPAVLQRDDGSYHLLNLGFTFHGFRLGQVLQRSGILFRWSSVHRKWTKQDVGFNPQIVLPIAHRKRPMYDVDVAFTFKGRVFWADLLLGAIVCDMGDEDSRELGFIHLPEECKGKECKGSYLNALEDAYPNERRTMGPVGDSIKFISIGTTNGDTPDDYTNPREVVLRSWTLAPDFTWTRDADMEVPLPQLWESDGYKREKLPEAVPLNPVLKEDEDGVLYLLLGDYYIDPRRNARLCRTMECVISIDMRRKSLLSRSHRPIKEGLLLPQEVQPSEGLLQPQEVQASEGFFPDMPNMYGVKFCAQHTGWSSGLPQKRKRNHLE